MRPAAWLVLLMLVAPPARGADPPAKEAAAKQAAEQAAPAEPAPDWIRPEAIPAQADALLAQIEAARLDPAKQAHVDEIEKSLAELAPQLDKLSARVQRNIARNAPLDQLDELTRELDSAAAPLDKWQETLEAEALRVADVSKQLASAQASWSATLARPEIAEADPVVARRIRSSLDLLHEASAAQRSWSDRVLALEDRIVERRAGSLARSRAWRRTPTRSAPRCWSRPGRRSGAATSGRGCARSCLAFQERLGRFVMRNREYLLRDPRPLVAQLVFAVLLAWWLRRAGRAARERAAAAPELSETARVLERPISIAVLVTLLVSPWLHPLAPRRFTQLLALIALVPVWRVITHVSPVRLSRTVFAGLFGVLLIDRVRLGLERLPAVAQTIFLLELALGIALAIRVLRRGGLPGRPGGSARVPDRRRRRSRWRCSRRSAGGAPSRRCSAAPRSARRCSRSSRGR